MDDILICTETDYYLETVLQKTIQAIEEAGFEIAMEKIQCTCPCTYLGFRIGEQTIASQKLTIKDNPRTLRGLQQLSASINWVHNLIGITTEDLAPLFNLLRGSDDLDFPQTITPEAQEVIQKVSEVLSTKQAHRIDPALPFQFNVLGKTPRFHGLIFQWDPSLRDQLLIIEWVFISDKQNKTITTPQELMAQLIIKARARLKTLAGCEFTYTYLPVTLNSLEPALLTNEHLQFALDSSPGQISIHPPKHKLFNTCFNLVPKSLKIRTPLKALTAFTDGSGRSHKSVITWKNPDTQEWESDVQIVQGSPQIAELASIVRAFEKFKQPLNLVTDSDYVVRIIERAEHSLLKEVSNPNL
ncbi:hypothetical protein DUI87_01255 [Hirundo rustica rustica]|uniref:ribonuclease H n=1 Tax=Hirundo rustica rustica TaxID=333673 RepID=A0A3M0L4V3_HIRRU|nr:hypothetical protein DUI87_01255 [Hirundo rustica rustica]